MSAMWRKINGYSKYEVSDSGKVRNVKMNRILKSFDNKREGGGTMSYICVRELKVESTTIPAGAIIEHVGHDSIRGMPFVTFKLGFEHYAVSADAFEEYFKEEES